MISACGRNIQLTKSSICVRDYPVPELFAGAFLLDMLVYILTLLGTKRQKTYCYSMQLFFFTQACVIHDSAMKQYKKANLNHYLRSILSCTFRLNTTF